MFKLKDVKLNAGATLNEYGEVVAYAKGYQVSHKDLMIIPVYKLTKKLIMECIMDLLHGEHLGIWIDNGKAYIDLSEHIATKKEAMKAGKERKQLSIWNWKAGEAIAC